MVTHAIAADTREWFPVFDLSQTMFVNGIKPFHHKWSVYLDPSTAIAKYFPIHFPHQMWCSAETILVEEEQVETFENMTLPPSWTFEWEWNRLSVCVCVRLWMRERISLCICVGKWKMFGGIDMNERRMLTTNTKNNNDNGTHPLRRVEKKSKWYTRRDASERESI